MKIVITGSTGRVGANLAKRLCDHGLDVTACILPRDEGEYRLDGMKLKKAFVDILNTEGMAEVIKGSDIVIHTAAIHEGSLLEIPYYKFFDINVKGMFNVLEGIRSSGKNTRLICLSSSAVYDVFTAPRSPIRESEDRKPITLYGMTKILVEEQIRQYEWQYGIPSIILRPNYIVAGPEILQAFNYSVVFDVLQRYADNKKVQFHTPNNPYAWMTAKQSSEMIRDTLCVPRCPEDESWRWHMVDVRDVIDLIERCLENKDAYGKTFNVAAMDVCDWSQLVPYIAEKTKRKIVEVEIPNLWQYSFDQSASKEILDFEPKYDHFAMVDTAIDICNNKGFIAQGGLGAEACGQTSVCDYCS